MNMRIVMPALLLTALISGCAEMQNMGGPGYGESSTEPASQTERTGTISRLEIIQVDNNYKFGVGTAAGAVAGGILGSQIGDSKTATVAGAVLGGLAGTVAESKMRKQEGQRVTVNMSTGGTLTITQPKNTLLREGMSVRIEGSGTSARVVPR